MLKTEKEHVVADLVERLRAADTLIVADYRGLTHAELDGVRTELLGHGARLTVCKNRLTRIAASAAGADGLLEFLTGPTAIAFVHDGDMIAVARTLNETARTTRRLELKGAVLEGRSVGAEAVRELATLPPTEVLRGQVLGAIVAPVTSLLGLVNAPLTNLVGLIDARIEQLGGADAVPMPEEATSAGSADEPVAADPAGDGETAHQAGDVETAGEEDTRTDAGGEEAEPEAQAETGEAAEPAAEPAEEEPPAEEAGAPEETTPEDTTTEEQK
jgi:large subunit ribosomal protein L10